MADPVAASLHHLHHLLWECNVAVVPVTDEAFAGSGLTLALAGTLDIICVAPGSTVADLTRTQPKTQQAISQLTAKLEKLGLIERRLGRGRGVGLYPTAEGERINAEGARREQQIEDRVCALLGAETAEQLRDALEAARRALRRHDAERRDRS